VHTPRHATQQVSPHVRASGRVERIKALYLRCIVIVIVFLAVFIVFITVLVLYVAFGILCNFLLVDLLSLLVLFVVFLRLFLLLLFFLLFLIVLLLLFLFALGLLVLFFLFFFIVLAYERQLDLRLRSGSHNDGQRLWLGHCEWWPSDCVSTAIKI
jgi:hypothetical protein